MRRDKTRRDKRRDKRLNKTGLDDKRDEPRQETRQLETRRDRTRRNETILYETREDYTRQGPGSEILQGSWDSWLKNTWRKIAEIQKMSSHEFNYTWTVGFATRQPKRRKSHTKRGTLNPKCRKLSVGNLIPRFSRLRKKRLFQAAKMPKISSREATYHLIVDFTCQKSLFQDRKLEN